MTDKKRLNEDVDADIKRRTHNSYLGYVIEPSEELLAAARDYLQKNGVRAQLKQYKDSNRYDCTVSPKWGYLVDGFENLGSKFNPDYDGTVKGYFRNESWEKYAYFCVKGPRFSKVYDLPESLDKSNKLTLNENLFEEPLKEARDFEWDDTLWAVVKEDGRFAGIPCITDTEAKEVAYQHEGSHIYKMTLEDSLDEDLILAPQEDALEGPQTEEEVGVSHLILDAIACVTEMISMYNDITANTSDEEITSVINQIAEDNNKHMGMLQGILTNVSPNAEAIQDGVEEVAVDEVVTVDPEFIPVEESLDKSLNESFWFGKYVDIDGKTHKVYFKFEGDFEAAEEEFNEIIPEPYTKAVLSGRADEPGLKRDGFTLINEHLNEDLHGKFKKEIKNAYKEWTAEVEKAEQKRKELMDIMPDNITPEQSEKVQKFIDDSFPMPKDFEFNFPKNIEKDDYPFYVTYYAEYPIYEPAEGGYYYAGRDAVWSEGYNSEEEARECIEDFVNEQEDKNEWEGYNNGYVLHGKYIGEDQYVKIEKKNEYLSDEKGWEPYQ